MPAKVGAGPGAGTPSHPRCVACGSELLRRCRIPVRGPRPTIFGVPWRSRPAETYVCASCGYVRAVLR